MNEEKKFVTHEQFLEILGLATLARKHRLICEETYNLIKKDFDGFEDYFTDVYYEDGDLEPILLEKLSHAEFNVEVKKE